MQPILNIARDIDIKKLLAFLRAGAPVTFNVKEELKAQVIQRLKEFAKENRISVRYVEPGLETVLICSTAGSLIGAGAGAMLGGIPGAIVGGGVGLVLGYACAHMSVTISPRADGEPGFTFELARA